MHHLRGDDRLIAAARNALADDLLGTAAAVSASRVDEVASLVEGVPDDGCCDLFVIRPPA